MHIVRSLVVLNVLCLWPAPSLPGATFLLAKQRAGDLEIGMSVDEAFRKFGSGDNVKLVDLRTEGFFTPAVQIYLPSAQGRKPSLVAEISWWRTTIAVEPRDAGHGLTFCNLQDPAKVVQDGPAGLETDS